ncbi:kelch repeat-containing protein At3g27220-like isoform X1 [Phalaenopsis equestris]|uniref:kelch repeat-containing protein At3g27220-like isoform X1 n=2 Tax=Phalaenopsis equestris TaxID=78828 RepID=UPI0009E32FDE|nr:kelch repeat-containing protein At3g27220-like isoform X1 [Phalaenopsis equestris]
MARFVSKSASRRYLVLLFLIALFGVVLIANFLWATSSSSASSPNWYTNLNLTLKSNAGASAVKNTETGKKNSGVMEGQNLNTFNATFADIPAPQLEWEEMAEAPVPRLDGAAIQIKDLLYVFAGYGTINYVHSHVDIYNFTDNTWVGKFDMPKEMAHSHLGMATDGRHIYIVTGQYGPQCRGPTTHNFVLDTETKTWHDLPPLPFPRYAPATQLWRGRLHVMGGSKEDRHEPALEHWSLPVKDGKALEKEWRTEIPIPRGGPHRACVIANDKLIVIGGQEGDFMAKPGSPIFKCVRRSEVVYNNVYMLDDGLKWRDLPPMPKPNSHIEFAWKFVNNSIIIVGGTTEKHPVTKKIVLVGEVFQFNLSTMEWSVIGRMPFRMKTTLVGFWNGWLYFTSGQRDKGPNDPSPKKVVGCMWRTKLQL